MSNQVPEEMAEADRLVREAVQKISEHVDAVTVFVTKKRENGNDGTWRMAFGAGNYYARYGQIKQWVIFADEEVKVDCRSSGET